MPPDQTKQRNSIVTWLTVAAAFLAAYVLSLGPAAWMTSNACLSFDSYNAIYRPIDIVRGSCGPLDAALGSYERLWLRLPRRDAGPRPEIQSDGSLPYVEP